MRYEQVKEILDRGLTGRDDQHQGKLHPSTKRGWIEKLRSGDYSQGLDGHLYIDGQYCCLGVLADHRGDLLKRETKPALFGVGATRRMSPKYGSSSVMPTQGYRYAGLTWTMMDALADANDRGATFKQIAKWIEVNL
jgi:hypothetical protein